MKKILIFALAAILLLVAVSPVFASREPAKVSHQALLIRFLGTAQVAHAVIGSTVIIPADSGQEIVFAFTARGKYVSVSVRNVRRSFEELPRQTPGHPPDATMAPGPH